MAALTVPALGRVFTPGMLYNARTDDLLPGLSLWNNETLQEKTVQTAQTSSSFHISTSDSIKSKSSQLDIDDSLSISFLCGLIKVGGAAKYLNSSMNSKKKSRVTFWYNATTHFKQLSMSDLMTMNPWQKEIIEKGTATHVVTGITYGVNCFFVFESEKLENSSSREIGVEMEAVIKKIPSLGVEGELKNKLSDEEKAMTEKFSCTFFGDVILEKDPATFEEAVKTYSELPKLLGENGENCVPLKVWLVPLKDLIPSAPEVRTISPPLVREVENTLENLREIQMRCDDLMDDPEVQAFPQIKKNLKRFKKECSYYVSDFKKAIAEKLPLIREGTEDEGAVREIIQNREASPFSSDGLNKWMRDAERKNNVIRSVLGILKGATILPNKSKLDRVVLDPNTRPGLCFVFTSLDSPDPHLDAMTSFPDLVDTENTEEVPWFYSDDVVEEMRRLAQMLNADSGQVLISAIELEDVRGACLYKFYEGKLQDYDPTLDVEKVTEKKDLKIYCCKLTLDPDTAHKSLLLSDDNKVVPGSSQEYEDLPQRFDSVPQVLCKQGLNKRCYWELSFDVDDEHVLIGVCYKGMSRKGSSNAVKLGENPLSWCLDVKELKTKASFTARHNNESVSIPATLSTGVAVFLDWPAGTLSFYNVLSSTTLSHLHTFHTTFSEPVYPALSILRKKGSIWDIFKI